MAEAIESNDLLKIVRGNTEYIDVTITGLTAEQITTVTFAARQRPDSPHALIEKALNDGITLSTDDDGALVAAIALEPGDTSWIPALTALDYGVRATDLSGGVHTVALGRLEISADPNG